MPGQKALLYSLEVAKPVGTPQSRRCLISRRSRKRAYPAEILSTGDRAKASAPPSPLGAEQRGGFRHALGDGHAERAVRLAGGAAGAVPGANLERQVVIAHGCGHLVLHLRQIVVLVHRGYVDARAELLGLQWRDFDFEKKLLHIQRAVTQTKGGILIDKPKTKTSIRDIPISDFIIAILEKIERTGLYVITGKHPNEPMKPHTYADHFSDFMKRMQKETGLPILTPHELRHTFGTLLRENDVDIYTIQKVLGHSDITVTSNIYVHNDIEVLRKRLKVDEK